MLPRKLLSRVESWLGFLAASASFTASGQSIPKLDSIQSTWFQRGTTNEVTVQGDALAGVGEVRITGMGVQGSISVSVSTNFSLEGANGGLVATAPSNAKSAMVRLVIHRDAPPGPREVRVLGPNGISNPLTLQISDLPEIAETKGNGSLKDAQLLTLPVAVSGIIDKAATSDWYRFQAKAGEKLIFDVQANRNGIPLDPTLILSDSAGKELARSEDAHGLDPWLEFTPSADGEYWVQIHDLRFQGGGDYRYRLVAGILPYLDQVFPFGGRRGNSMDLTLRGRNLEGAEKMTLKIAADAPLGRQDIRARTARGYSNPLPFEATDLPDVFESEPNNGKEKANMVGGPASIHGRIGEKGDVDWYRIRSGTDQRWVLEVRARTYGSPLDALLILSDANGAVLQQNDDASGPDARIEFDAKKDTDYLVSIRDLTERGGDRFGYRLTLQPPGAVQDYAVRANLARARVYRDGVTAIRCEVERRNGFNGVVRFQARDLPVGVESSTLVIPPEGPQFGWLTVDAAAAAPLGTQGWQILGMSDLSGNPLARPAQFPESPFMTVLPAAALTVDALTPSVSMEQNAEAPIEIAVQRANGFNGEVKIVAEDLPGLSVGGITIPAGQTRGKLMARAAFNCETSTRPLMFRAEAQVDGVSQVQHTSASVPVTVVGVPFYITAMLPGSPFFRTDPVKLAAVALPTNSTSAANSSEFVVKVERRNFTNEIQIALEGVPSGVIATTAAIAPNAKETTIRLLVTDKTATGTNFTFNVLGSAPFGDRTFRQKTVPVTLAVTAREPETAAVTPTNPAANTK